VCCRLFAVLEKQLEGKAFVTGDEISIADFAIFTWARGVTTNYNQAVLDGIGFSSGELPNVTRWIATMNARPGVQRGLNVK